MSTLQEVIAVLTVLTLGLGGVAAVVRFLWKRHINVTVSGASECSTTRPAIQSRLSCSMCEVTATTQ